MGPRWGWRVACSAHLGFCPLEVDPLGSPLWRTSRGSSPTNSEDEEKKELPQGSPGEEINHDITPIVITANVIMARV